jgi:hypothetical protein
MGECDHGDIAIALFAFNRPSHLEKCLESLKTNMEARLSDLTIFVDGPRNLEDRPLVDEVLNISREVKGFKSTRIIESPKNKGLSKSIIDGVTNILKESETVIVLEDDLIVSKYFLSFMQSGLVKFKQDTRVASIHGYLPNLSEAIEQPFFLRGADCWGWATWRDRWEQSEWSGTVLHEDLKSNRLVSRFNFDGAYNYLGMLERQISGENDSWAIRWHASMYTQNRLTLYPNKSLVVNIGMDGSGRHSSSSTEYDTVLTQNAVILGNIPIEEDERVRKLFKKFFIRNKKINKGRRILRALRQILLKLRKLK